MITEIRSAYNYITFYVHWKTLFVFIGSFLSINAFVINKIDTEYSSFINLLTVLRTLIY